MVANNTYDAATKPMESPHEAADLQSTLLGLSAPGTLLNDRYLIEKELGRGGIGVVYLGRDQQLLSRPVVIKFLLDESAGKAWFQKKFRQEIEALARIDHPGVIGVLDAGQMPDGKLYLVMQFVEGVNLRTAIGSHGMELKRVAQIMRQMGQAISAAHDKGICHRDLKPENIMLQSLGEGEEHVKIIDFGVARVKDSRVGTNRETTALAGTVAYMAPEQLMGKPSPSSDVYAMGVIAYEMVTGRRPFNPDSPYQLLEMQRAGVRVKPKNLRPELNEGAQKVILNALSFELKDRCNRAREFGDTLAEALTAGTMVTPARQKKSGVNKELALPSGTVTFLFTDIEGSTKLWEQYPSAMQITLAQHDQLLRKIIEAEGGYVFKTVGDAFCAAFKTAQDALSAAFASQRALRTETWGETGPVRVRMALHTGTAELRDGDYFGPALNRVARLLSLGYGGQTLLSQTTYGLVRNVLPEGAGLRDLGEHRLKDLQQSERVFQIVTGDMPADFPALRSLSSRPNNLPIQPTPLIGREAEMSTVEKLLRYGPYQPPNLQTGVRLLTLTGPGGTGKTRLALEAAVNLIDEFEGGVFFVSLAAVRDSLLVASFVSQALGLKELGGMPLLDSLTEYLRDKQILLLLDNFEHVLPAAPLVAQLLADCPQLKILVTSRAALHLRGEYEFSLAPLGLPDPKHLPEPETLTQCPAIALFVQRALAVKPDFQITKQNGPQVAEICTRLDGLPLAIELAAARIKLLPPQAMLVRLENRLKVLTDGARDLPARQQTMRSAIAWSYDLLDADDKALFRRLSVFCGGCTLEAIEAVCNASGDLKSDSFEGISSLVDKNLVRQEEQAGGEPWFAMLETIREYASECLEASGEARALRHTHTNFYLTLAEAAEPELTGPGQAAELDQIERAHDNLRAALHWSKQNHDVETGLRLSGAVWRFWKGRGHLSEGRKWLEVLSALAENGDASKSTRAKAFRAQGILARMQGDYDNARSLLEKSLSLYRELGDKRGIALALDSLGTVLLGQDDYNRAAGLLGESLELRREMSDKLGMANSLSNLAIVIVTYQQGDYGRAQLLCEESLTLYRELKCEWGIATSLNNLGAIANQEGDHDRAKALFVQSLALFQELGDKAHIAICLEGLAGVACAQKELERAARLLGAAKAFSEASDTPLPLYMRTEHECSVAALRTGLSESVFTTAWAEGEAMTIEEAVAYASKK